jgi:ribosomal protein S18 acetylase RimI-like enzyme
MTEHPQKSPDPIPPRQQRTVPENTAPFTCSPLSPDTVEATARLYAEVFVRDEPTTRWHGVTVGDFLPFARRYVQFCETRGLSYIAREEQSGDVIGFIFCSDLTTGLDELGPAMRGYLSRFEATIRIIGALEEQYLNTGAPAPGTFLHVDQLGVCRERRDRSVSTALIRHVAASARKCGFHTIVADCTGPRSCRSFERCGFTRAGSIPYALFPAGGIALFDGLEGEIALMVKDL